MFIHDIQTRYPQKHQKRLANARGLQKRGGGGLTLKDVFLRRRHAEHKHFLALTQHDMHIHSNTNGVLEQNTKKGKTVETSEAEKNRIKQRYDVNLKAEVSLTGENTHMQQCRITNLSASGARLHFEKASSVQIGMHVAIKIFIPATIMHIPNSGGIMWVKQQNNETSVGVKFQDVLSEIMMERLVKTGSPAAPYNPH